MKKGNKRFWTTLMCLVALTTLTSAIPVSAQISEGRAVYFSIPMNLPCQDNFVIQMALNVTNLSGQSVPTTVNLYTVDGTPMIIEGNDQAGYTSDITPGTAFNLDANATRQYHITLQNNSDNPEFHSCSNKVFSGKIELANNSGLVVASGSIWTYHHNRTTNETYNTSSLPININDGQPF